MVYFKYFNPSEIKEYKNTEKIHKGGVKWLILKTCVICLLDIGFKYEKYTRVLEMSAFMY